MEIVFDEANIKASGDPESENNKPEQLVQRYREKLEKLGEFIGADKVEYIDGHKRETYVITKNGETMKLITKSTPLDGGWLELSF